jgi:hypothetical protein
MKKYTRKDTHVTSNNKTIIIELPPELDLLSDISSFEPAILN